MPYICKVAAGKLPKLFIYGGDFNTRDGSGERDYIHVCDLADGHIQALKKLEGFTPFQVINLGTGKGTTVFEMLNVFQSINHVTIPVEVVERRPGDIAISLTNTDLAKAQLNFTCKHDLEKICEDAWRYHSLQKL